MLRRCSRTLACVVMAAALGATSAPAASASDDACALADTPVSTLGEFGAQFVTICVVNEKRAAAGAGPVTFDPKLYLAGYGHASDMVARQYFSHQSPDGLGPGDRIAAAHYGATGEQWEAGEDLAWGSATMSTPRAIVEGWMNSATHRTVMLDPSYKDIGIGIKLGAPLQTGLTENATYAAEFGTRTAPAQDDADAPIAVRSAPAPAPRVKTATCLRRARTSAARAECNRIARLRAAQARRRAQAQADADADDAR
jgi:uncharacterized protein YkwD